MMEARTTLLLACGLLVTASWLSACKEGDTTSVQSSLPASMRAQIDDVVAAYEVVRKALADDKSDVTAESRALADSAAQAAALASGSVRAGLEEVASAANRLAGEPSVDLGASRRAFGEVSKALISLLSLDAGLRAGRHVYECPMAKGYKKWVQVSEDVANPYMGSEMLKCGEEAAF